MLLVDGYEPGSIISERYRVIEICSSSGGMGAILHVEPLLFKTERRLVLKFCRESSPELRSRFIREVRLLSEFDNNPRVVEILDKGLEDDPPWFVMPFYAEGDLTTLNLKHDEDLQEKTFLEMADCVSELHSRGVFHRDIKPQNFLRDGSGIRVADFGLSTEIGSETALTRSSVFWGTQGFLPPEFAEPGGFKKPNAASDIFMLGKSMYSLLTGRRDPTYLVKGSISEPVFFVIERCCETDAAKRIQSVAEFKQRLVDAYDVVLNRQDNFSAAQQLLQRIREDVARYQKFDISEAKQLLDRLLSSPDSEREIIFRDLKISDFRVLCFTELSDRHSRLLDYYRKFVERGGYGWSFAEHIAQCMMTFVESNDLSPKIRAEAFEIAVIAAELQNRFAAMDTCRAALKRITDEALAVRICQVLENQRSTFLGRIPWSECQSGIIRKKLQDLAPS